MPSSKDYALFSANSYAASANVVNENNVIPIPDGWVSIERRADDATGFLARAYTNGSEIVIAYAGTTWEDGMKSLDWVNGNIPGATASSLAGQIVDAARFYLDVLKSNPGVEISFTGHSLGGGLASLMAVFFDKQAYTFDEAPFERSADSDSVVNALKQRLAADYSLADLAPEFSAYVPGTTNLAREGNVQSTYVNGEVLRNFRAYLAAAATLAGGPVGGLVAIAATLAISEIAGPAPNVIDPQATGTAATDLHDIRILTAFLQSPAFLQANRANPDFLQQLFKSPLYVDKTQNRPEHNFLNLMLQQQAAGNQALDRLAEDIGKFTGALDPVENNVPGADDLLKSALYQLTLALYYGEGENRTGVMDAPFESLIKSVPGGIQFAPDPERKVDYKVSLRSVLDELGLYFADVKAYLKQDAGRYTLPTEGAMDVLEVNDDKTDVMLGSTHDDTLQGGRGGDILLGRAGADRLDGGDGEDTLFGGAGADILNGGDGEDTYVINTGDGNDQIDDSDHSIVKRDGKMFNGGFSQIANTNTYELITDDQVKISINSPATLDFGNGDTITFQDLTTVDLVNQDLAGIRLFKAAEAPTTTLTITGDITPTDIDPSKAGIQAQGDAQSNPIGASQPYGDILGGSDGNDHILAGELNDDVGGGAGDDWIEGGNGNDYLGGRTGDDLIEGGAGNDLLFGESGDDQLYANTQIDIATAIANGNSDTGSGQKGDWLSGNAGDDTLVADADNDVLTGGGGADLLVAGAGDDYILGDADYYAQYLPEDTPRYSISGTDWYHSGAETFDWTVTIDQDGTAHFYPVVGETDPADSGADVIYAGAGADRVWAGAGDDVLYGDDGDDTLDGQAGNDILIGGADNDVLFGGEDNDYLDGGDGVDTLWGGNGDDDLFGGAGDDKLYGETGANYLDGEDGNDILNSGGPGSNLFGGAGDDDLSAADGGNYLDGEDGNDSLTADAGDNTLFGGAGDDDLSAGGGNNYLDGEEGTNTLYADGGGNTLFAGAGDDNLSAGGGNNYLDGGDGTNMLIADGGANTLYGGAGDDTLSSAGGNSYLEGGDGTNTILADGGGNTVYSGTGDDTLSSTGGNSTLDGGDGNDLLIADLGGNTLDGGAGDDTLSSAGGGSYLDGGDGNDILIADGGNNTLFGGAGEDRLSAGGGANMLDGGAGNDTYVFDSGFGENHIADSGFLNYGSYKADLDDINMALFQFDFAGSGLEVGLGSLKLSFANGDVLHIDGYDPNDPLNSCSISTFQFNDQTLSLQDILDLGGPAVNFTIGPDIVGTDNADVIQGTDKAEHIDALAGDDIINAGARDDTIEGGDGDDTIDGGIGADVMKGGAGNDTYVVDNTGDTVTENLDEGWDAVQSSISYTLGDHVEGLTLTGADNIDGTGNALDNYINGNDSANVLSGAAGDDWLDGGAGDDTLAGGAGNDTLSGGAGADVMAGGSGSDVYVVDSSGDAVTENPYEGTDTVQSSISYALGANLENLSLTGTDAIDGAGNELDNQISGNSADNLLAGGAGNDALGGGAGADTMVGGTGDDSYSVDDAGDMVVENLGEGTDLVVSTISYTLPDNVENLSLFGQGNVGTGNALDNVITGYNANIAYALSGEAGNDTLTGNDRGDTLDGGSGADVMTGGYGDDAYYVDEGGDQVVENYVGKTYTAGGGYQYTIVDIDTVNSSISYTLGDNLENLNLTGADNIYGAGNALDNVINGNAGANSLEGGAGNDTLNGGAGADVMDGGAGKDTYYVDDAGDQAIETVVGLAQWSDGRFYAGEPDRVYSSVSFTLGDNLEDLTLTGSDNIDGGGNALANLIIGNVGVNALSGGAGDDIYYVKNSGDTVIENAGNGIDRVYANVDFALSGNTEFLYLNDGAVIGIGDDSNNTIEGNIADNLLDGKAGDDHLDGRAGNDTISGGDGNDVILGGYDDYVRYDNGWQLIANSDVLDGGAGEDNIDGGSGNDTITGGAGDDVLVGGYDDGGEGGDPLPNNDTIDGGDGNDSIDGGSGADTLFGDAGDDVIYGGDNSWGSSIYDPATDTYTEMSDADVIDGGAGDDTIDGQAGDDVLRGGAGADVVYGGDGNDTLDGGTGLDTLSGGQGDDVYVVDGSYVQTAGVPALNDCGEPVLTEQLVWTTDAVTEYGGEGYDAVYSSAGYALTDDVEELRLTFDPAMAAGDPQRYADLLAFGQNGFGNDLDNLIVGDELANRLEGGAGDDTLEGGAGSDTLVGDAGNDTLRGGAGDDRYVFRLGDGADRVVDSQGSDTLHLGGGLTLADIQVVNDNGDAVVSIDGTDDSIVLDNWFGQIEGVSLVELCDGTVLDRQGIAIMASSPIPDEALPDQTTLEDDPYSFAVPADTFSYSSAGSGDTLSYSATLANGAPLPHWLSLDAASGIFSGTPTNWDVGALGLSVMATNAAGNSASSNFTLDVLNVNDAPTVIGPLPDQSATQGQAFSYTLPSAVAQTGFLNDATDTGTPDRVWPVYDNSVGGGSGNDTYSFARGDGNVYFSDWDETPGNVDTIELADVLPGDVSTSQNEWGDVIVSVSGTGDSLTLEEWLYSDESKIEQLVFADGTVWGVDDIQSGLSTSPTTGNDYIVAPMGNNTIDALDGNDGISGGIGNDTLLGGAGDDVLIGGEGSDILSGGSGSDEADSSWGDWDGGNDLLSGGVGDDFLGGWVANELLVGGQGNDTVGGYDGASVILFNRGDGNDWIDPWSSGVGTQADTVSLGGGIGLGDLTFSRDGDNLVLDAGDGESIVFDSWFGANWSDYSVDGNKVVTRLQIVTEAMPGYDPDSADPLYNKRIQQFDFVGLAGRFETALAGDPAMGAWQLAPHLAEFALGGSDTAAIGGAMAYLYGKDGNLDGLTEAEVRAQLSDAAFGTASQTLTTAAPLPGSGVFDDVDFIHGDKVTYSATRADGSPLPGWLSFDAASGTFSGTPLNADVGNLDLAVSASDTGGLSASTPLSISIANVNDSPTAADDLGAVQEDGGAVTLSAASLLSNDTDPDVGDTLDIVAVSQPDSGATVSLLAPTSPGQASDVQYDLGSLYQSLGAGQTATDTFGYTIADAAGATSNAIVTMTITGVNDAPVTAADFAAVQEDGVLTTTGNVLSNDTDVDAGTVLAVADAGVRQGNFGGLTLAADGAYSYTLDNAAGVVQALAAGQSATDMFSYGASDGIVSTPATLSVSIAGVNDAPVVASPIADQSAAAGGPFNFTFADSTFFDIDSGDSLAYTAGLADGAALPSWLSFDAATRTFSGTPPGGATTGGNCGSGGGAGTASSLQLRVYATDTAGASTFDDFALNVSGDSGGGGGSGGGGAPGGGGDDDHSHHNHGGDHSGNHGGDHGDGRDGDRHDHGHHDDSAKCRDARDTIAARLKKKPDYDFGALSNYLAQHRGGGDGALSAAQVAAQWRSVQARVAQLAQDDEDSRRGAHSGEHYGGDDGFAHGANYWGYAGSTGQNRGCGGMATFGGLDEGFRKLG